MQQVAMLNPASREIYLDQMRPPDGYRLDHAVGTTFSLDLPSLLMVPISMVKFDATLREDTFQDPIAALEALRRTTDRFVVFCQQARILVPKNISLLYSYLEQSVVEANAPNPPAVFHPKTWLLRFESELVPAPVVYRFLCLSRNLTFSRSWDTVLALEGQLSEGRRRAYGRNRPLSDFVAALPHLTPKIISQRVKENVELMADEILRVDFEPPEDFPRETRFMPSGISGYKKGIRLGSYQRTLVLSPFLGEGTVKRLSEAGRNNVLISRFDSLDGLSNETIRALEKTTQIFFMDDGAELPDTPPAADEGESTELPLDDLSGLHAKLVILEEGPAARVITGSANFTSAAMNGTNVEFVVQLAGQKRKVGIEAFLGDEDSKFSLRSLLRSYTRSEPSMPDGVQKQLEESLEKTRQLIVDAAVTLEVFPGESDGFDVVATAGAKGLELPEGITGLCHPVTVPDNHAVPVQDLLADGTLVFKNLTLRSLTGFTAFALQIEREGRKASTAFVLNLPISGVPPERDNHILRTLILDRESFIRYILFILAAGDDTMLASHLHEMTGPVTRKGKRALHQAIPLLEEMIKAYSRDPTRISRIAYLVEDLRKTGREADLLPEGFGSVWAAFVEAIGGAQ
jgi:hypothetical protein